MATTQTQIVSEDFLRQPGPTIEVSRIDFEKVNLPEYKGRYAVILDNVLAREECEQLVEAAESSTSRGWERAMINIGGGKQRLMTEERNCGRIIWDSRNVVARIWKRIEHLPEVQEIVRLEDAPKIVGNGPGKRGEVWGFTRPNERMRFLKYIGGEYFRTHCDGSYETPDGKERTYFTLHLYLNNADVVAKEDAGQGEASTTVLVGGETTFFGYDMKRKCDVLPKAGRILLFQHRDLMHSGEDVVSGVKYTMRTDLLYALQSSKAQQRSNMPVLEDEPMTGNVEGTDGSEEAKRYGF